MRARTIPEEFITWNVAGESVQFRRTRSCLGFCEPSVESVGQDALQSGLSAVVRCPLRYIDTKVKLPLLSSRGPHSTVPAAQIEAFRHCSELSTKI
jgi:hypothetical protein